MTRATAAATHAAARGMGATAAATHTTAATEMATTTGSMSTTAATVATTTTAVATTTFIGRVGCGRQRSRKNNDGNPEFECRHNFLRLP